MELTGLNAILQADRIALDANIFIYALTKDPHFPIAAEILRGIRDTERHVVTSILTLTEITVPIFQANRPQKLEKYLEFVTGNGRTTVIEVNQAIAITAARYRALYQLKTPDAIHLATAVVSGAEVFVTADRDFRVKKIKAASIEGVQIEVI